MRREPARYAAHPLRRAAARGLFRLLGLAALAAVAVALAPVTLTAAASAAFGWWRGWPPRRLYAVAAWCLPMAVAWLAAVAAWPVRAAGAGGAGAGAAASPAGPIAAPPAGVGPGPLWVRVAAAPARAWLAMWHLAGHGTSPPRRWPPRRPPSRSASWPVAWRGRTGCSGCGPARAG